MKKIKLIRLLSTTALIGSILPITSCNKKPEIVQHTITFTASEGIDLSGETTVKVNDKTKWKDVTKPTVSSKIQDFQILGWYNGPEEISDETEITSDITAKCVGYDPRATFNEVTVVTAKAEYKDNTFIQGGTWGGFKTYYEITQDPEKEGFTFDGWYVDDTKINDDYVFPVGQLTATVTAKFIENKKTVSFAKTEGVTFNPETPDPVEVESGTTWGEVDKPTATVDTENYWDLGWYIEGEYTPLVSTTVIDRDITAKYYALDKSKVLIQVTLKIDGESNQLTFYQTGSWADFKTYYGIKDPVKEGYDFIGWYIGEDKIDETSYTFPAQSSITIEAKFKIKQVSVTFTKTDGVTFNPETPDPVKVDPNTLWKDVNKPTATVDTENYYDLGWYIDGQYTKLEDTTPITSNIAAKYCTIAKSEVLIQVTLKIDGESKQLTFYQTGSWADFKTYYGIKDPVKKGYDFIGWYVGEDKIDETSYTFPAQSSITIEAKFKIKQFSVTFTTDAGAEFTKPVQPISVNPNTKWSAIKKPSLKIKEGFIEDGWYNKKGGKMDDDTPITGNTEVIYRTIEISSHQVNVTIKVLEKTYDPVIFVQGKTWKEFKDSYIPKDPERPGYRFNYWTYNGEKISDDWRFPIKVKAVTIEANFSASFAADSWENVCKYANEGINKLHEVYKHDLVDGSLVGLEKTITINNCVHRVRVIGEGHDSVAGSSTKASLTFEMVTLLSEKNGEGVMKFWHNSDDNRDYPHSYLRNYLNSNKDSALSLLPEVLRNNIKTVTKEVATTSSFNVTKYNDKLFPLTCTEMACSYKYTKTEGKVYQYWEKHDTMEARIKKDSKGNTCNYWLASPHIDDTELACRIKTNGDIGPGFPTLANCVSFAFCI